MKKSLPPLGMEIVVGLIVTGLLFVTPPSPKTSKSVADSAIGLQIEERRERILAEIQEPGGHEWAGEYYEGDGRGFNHHLAVAPRSGFVFTSHGCLGLYDQNYGTVVSAGGRLRLAFTFANKRTGFEGIAPELVKVSWGSRRYLVPADELVEFCNAVNLGREPRTGSRGRHLLRVGDESKPVEGLPDLPAEYQDYLLPEPITATITEIGTMTVRRGKGEWKFREIELTLNAGHKDGLRVGMELVVTDPLESFGSLQITRVEESHSLAVMTQFSDGDRKPRAGWRVSTRSPLYDRDPE